MYGTKCNGHWKQMIALQQNSFQVENCVLKIPQNNEKFVYIDDDHTQWLYTMLLQNLSTDLYLDLYRYQLNFDRFI